MDDVCYRYVCDGEKIGPVSEYVNDVRACVKEEL